MSEATYHVLVTEIDTGEMVSLSKAMVERQADKLFDAYCDRMDLTKVEVETIQTPEATSILESQPD